MKYSYDLHIHSALSPCAEAEMTPNNIINMAVVRGLDIIAVTDHNSAANIPALNACAERYAKEWAQIHAEGCADRDFYEGAGKKPLLFIPGIEVESAEEVHISCLFADVDAAVEMGRFVGEHIWLLKNNEMVLGPQHVFDSEDNIIDTEEQQLLFPTTLTSKEIFEAAEKLGGCAYFSHVDRTSYGVLSVLGKFPDDISTNVAEVSDTEYGHEFATKRRELKGKTILCCSDAHRLADISRGGNFIDIQASGIQLTAWHFIDRLRNGKR